MALLLRAPGKASGLRQRFMRNAGSYRRIFSDKLDLGVWPKIVSILRFVDSALSPIQDRHTQRDKFLKRWRYLVALILVSKHLGTFAFNDKKLATFNVSVCTNEDVRAIWVLVQQRCGPSPGLSPRRVKATLVKQLCEDAAVAFGLTAVEAVDSGTYTKGEDTEDDDAALNEEVLEKVDRVLPNQPWKPGVHRTIASALNVPSVQVYAAIQELIVRGRRQRQVDGVVFDVNDNVVAIDSERVRTPEDVET